MIIKLSLPNTCIPSIHFRKIDMTTKNSGDFIRFPHSVHPPPPRSAAGGGGGGWQLNSYQISKRVGLPRCQFLEGLQGNREGCNFYIKIN